MLIVKPVLPSVVMHTEVSILNTHLEPTSNHLFSSSCEFASPPLQLPPELRPNLLPRPASKFALAVWTRPKGFKTIRHSPFTIHPTADDQRSTSSSCIQHSIQLLHPAQHPASFQPASTTFSHLLAPPITASTHLPTTFPASFASHARVKQPDYNATHLLRIRINPV